MKLKKRHINFCKFILQVNNKTTNVALYGELGRYPLYINILKQACKYLNHIQCAPEDSLLGKAYMYEEAKILRNRKDT